jgi:DNA mismatch endonuclease (patch repair protein)
MSKNPQKLPSPPRPTSAAVTATMRGNRSRDTRPELAVRRLLFGLGYRYRLHRRDIPGCPDIVFPVRRKLVFVHGCFWHQHLSKSCPLWAQPKSNLHYWEPKLRRNRERDRVVNRQLKATDWKVTVVWECQTKNHLLLARRLSGFLGNVTAVRSHALTKATG